VAILPTSTSYGADALIATAKVKSVKDLKKLVVRGLDLSVSAYMFARNLELLGEDPRQYKFTSMDPGAAALAMQQGQKGIDAIAVWNPFVLQTLHKRGDQVHVLFDSTSIPGEIIDMVVVAASSLDKPGGQNFARALVEAFYRVNQDMADPQSAEATLIAIGEKFANLPLEQMRKVVEQTRFYGQPAAGIGLFEQGPVLSGISEKKLSELMPLVVGFCKSYGILETEPRLAYDQAGEADLRFDSTYMREVASSEGVAAAE
jgi:NitT/TauT family transport system substrate-binding protein